MTHQMQVPISDDSAFFTVTCFTIWKSSLWVGTNRGTIAVMDANDGRCVHEIFFPGGPRKQVEIKHLALSSENEIWCSVNSTPRSKDSTFLTVFDAATHEKKLHYTDLESRVAVILPVHTSMWCGTKGGKILIFNSKNYSTGETSQLSAHEDIIRTMTVADRYVVSGSGSNDGYAAVWRAVSS
jgi:WD40 repeat protein